MELRRRLKSFLFDPRGLGLANLQKVFDALEVVSRGDLDQIFLLVLFVQVFLDNFVGFIHELEILKVRT